MVVQSGGQIVALVSAAQRSQAPIQRLADQVAGWFVPGIMVIAALAFVGWLCVIGNALRLRAVRLSV